MLDQSAHHDNASPASGPVTADSHDTAAHVSLQDQHGRERGRGGCVVNTERTVMTDDRSHIEQLSLLQTLSSSDYFVRCRSDNVA